MNLMPTFVIVWDIPKAQAIISAIINLICKKCFDTALDIH